MKRKYIITSIIIFSAVVVAGIALVRQKNELAPNNTAKEQAETTKKPTGTMVQNSEYEELAFPDNTLDTSDWALYRNEEFGFEVRYPKEWEIENELDKYSRLIFWPISRQGPDDRGTYMFISGKTLEEFIQDADASPKDFKFISMFSHNGVVGVIVETKLGVWNDSYPYPDEREIIRRYTFDVGNYRFAFYSPSADGSFEPVFEQILLSFKLIP